MDSNSEEYRKEQEKRGPIRPDKIIFLICLLSSCAIGVFFQKHLNSRKCSSKLRHCFSFSVGFLMLLLCYGIRCGHLLVLSSIVYVLLNALSPRQAFRISFIISISYLTWAHIYRMKIDYGGYSVDVSLPLMVLVQRLTLLAANLADGYEVAKEASSQSNGHSSVGSASPRAATLTPVRRQFAVLKIPTPIQFFSYCINFQTVMAGPPLAYNDYLIYIEGREEERLKSDDEREIFKKNRESLLFPTKEIKKYALQALVFLSIYLGICQFFRPSFYLSDKFNDFTLLGKITYLLLTGFTMRQHYYFAWTLCALSCLTSGLGFAGFKDDKTPVYSLVKSFNFKESEFPRSIKELADNWNLQTLRWLRITVFDRSPPAYRVALVFFISAFWHGFYPGYYLFFTSMAWFSSIGRQIRRSWRPQILSFLPDTVWTWKPPGTLEGTSMIYDTGARVVTYFLVNYTALAFVVLSFHDSILIWSRFHFAGHVLCLATHLLLLLLSSRRQTLRYRQKAQ